MGPVRRQLACHISFHAKSGDGDDALRLEVVEFSGESPPDLYDIPMVQPLLGNRLLFLLNGSWKRERASKRACMTDVGENVRGHCRIEVAAGG